MKYFCITCLHEDVGLSLTPQKQKEVIKAIEILQSLEVHINYEFREEEAINEKKKD